MHLTPEEEEQYLKSLGAEYKAKKENEHPEITEQQITAIVDLCAANGKLISREHAKEFIIANNKQLEAEKKMSFKDRMKNLQNKR